MEKEKYIKIYKKATTDGKNHIGCFKDLKEIANIYSNANYNTEEEKDIYVNNFIIQDTKKFIEIYLENHKNAKKTAEYFEVDEQFIFSKIIELQMYQNYINELLEEKKEHKINQFNEIDNLKNKNKKLLKENALLIQELEKYKTKMAMLERQLNIEKNKTR